MAVDTVSYEVLPDLAHRELKGNVWILGVKYYLPRGKLKVSMTVARCMRLQLYCAAVADKEAMLDDIRSRIWCSYRRNFRTISEFLCG